MIFMVSELSMSFSIAESSWLILPTMYNTQYAFRYQQVAQQSHNPLLLQIVHHTVKLTANPAALHFQHHYIHNYSSNYCWYRYSTYYALYWVWPSKLFYNGTKLFLKYLKTVSYAIATVSKKIKQTTWDTKMSSRLRRTSSLFVKLI